MWVKSQLDGLAGFTYGSKMATTVDCRAEWVQRRSELNKEMCGSREGQN